MSYPMKLVAATVEAVWGGKRLMNEKWNKHTNGSNIAESWELSCHEKGESVVAGRKYPISWEKGKGVFFLSNTCKTY